MSTHSSTHTRALNCPTIQIEISEYARMNTEIALPMANDPDSPPFSVQRYRIVGGNVNNAFRLVTHPFNGKLFVDLVVNGKLDREYREQYNLVVEATDGGQPPLTGRLEVEVEVLDANDNVPEFLQSHYTAHIPSGKEVPVGYPLVKVKARDADKGENARVTYRFHKAVSNPHTVRTHTVVPNTEPLAFEIDPDTGTVIVARSPLPEEVRIWEVWIAATDHGQPHPQESSVLLTVTVGGGGDIDDGDGQGSSQEEQPWTLNVVWLTEDATENAEENLPPGYVLARVAVEGRMKNVGTPCSLI